MTSSRRRRSRQGRAGPCVDWIERHGRAALVWLWSFAMRILRLAAVALETIAVASWSWFCRQRRSTQLVLVAVASIACVLAIYRRESEEEVYVTDEAEALARVIRSEVGGSSSQQRLHVAWATRNLARERGQTVARMACSPCGRQGFLRPVSSRHAATDSERALATLVLAAPDLMDPTGGASHFINPVLQDELARTGSVPGYAGNTYQVVRRRWIESYGWSPYYRLGADLEFWGPSSGGPAPVARKRRR